MSETCEDCKKYSHNLNVMDRGIGLIKEHMDFLKSLNEELVKRNEEYKSFVKVVHDWFGTGSISCMDIAGHKVWRDYEAGNN